MTVSAKLSKQRLLDLIDDLTEKPNDRLRVLGDAGIVSLTMTGAPAASVAAIAGVKSVFGLSAAVQLFGWTATFSLAAGPTALLIGCASALGLLAYAVTRLIYGGGLAEGRKDELLGKYKEELAAIKAKEQANSITNVDRTQFIISLRELIDADAIPVASAFRMIEMVEAGRMALSQAISLTTDCLETKLSNQLPWKSLNQNGAKRQL